MLEADPFGRNFGSKLRVEITAGELGPAGILHEQNDHPCRRFPNAEAVAARGPRGPSYRRYIGVIISTDSVSGREKVV